MRLRGQNIERIHVRVRRPFVFDLLDVFSVLERSSSLQYVSLLVTLRLRISSSFVTLSISFLLSSSTTKTFHCVRVRIRPNYCKEGDVGTHFFPSSIADRIQENY